MCYLLGSEGTCEICRALVRELFIYEICLETFELAFKITLNSYYLMTLESSSRTKNWNFIPNSLEAEKDKARGRFNMCFLKDGKLVF